MSDPKLLFWYLALAFFLGIVGTALAGWRAAARGDVERHRQLMQWVILLVVAFVVAYVAKVFVLGKEDLASWAAWERTVLYVHETFILLMLLAGARARWLARSLPESGEPLRGSHRLAGRSAILFGIFALLTALVVLANLTRHGMA